MLSGAVHVCRAAKEKDHLAGQHEREAGKLGDLHARKQQGLSPLEAEMENLRRCCTRLSHPLVAEHAASNLVAAASLSRLAAYFGLLAAFNQATVPVRPSQSGNHDFSSPVASPLW